MRKNHSPTKKVTLPKITTPRAKIVSPKKTRAGPKVSINVNMPRLASPDQGNSIRNPPANLNKTMNKFVAAPLPQENINPQLESTKLESSKVTNKILKPLRQTSKDFNAVPRQPSIKKRRLQGL